MSDDGCRCEAYAAVTERAALAGARWLGRGDVKGAEESAATAMREGLDGLEITGRVVVGGDEEADALAIGGTVGSGGAEVDLAVDPLEGRAVVARGDYGAMSMIAVGEAGSTAKAVITREAAALGRIHARGSVGEAPAAAHAAEEAETRVGIIGAREHQHGAQGERRHKSTKVHLRDS